MPVAPLSVEERAAITGVLEKKLDALGAQGSDEPINYALQILMMAMANRESCEAIARHYRSEEQKTRARLLKPDAIAFYRDRYFSKRSEGQKDVFYYTDSAGTELTATEYDIHEALVMRLTREACDALCGLRGVVRKNIAL